MGYELESAIGCNMTRDTMFGEDVDEE